MKTRLGKILTNNKNSYIQVVEKPREENFVEIDDLII